MDLAPKNLWFSRLLTFALAVAVGLSATYWVLQWSAAAALVPAATVYGLAPVVVQTAAVARVLGGGATSAAPIEQQSTALESSRFALVGVLAQGGATGAALIAVDGLRPKPFVVGTTVGDAWVLHSVRARQAVLVRPGAANGQANTGDAGLVLNMPPLADPTPKPTP